jgi:hypothetical protein
MYFFIMAIPVTSNWVGSTRNLQILYGGKEPEKAGNFSGFGESWYGSFSSLTAHRPSTNRLHGQ